MSTRFFQQISQVVSWFKILRIWRSNRHPKLIVEGFKPLMNYFYSVAERIISLKGAMWIKMWFIRLKTLAGKCWYVVTRTSMNFCNFCLIASTGSDSTSQLWLPMCMNDPVADVPISFLEPLEDQTHPIAVLEITLLSIDHYLALLLKVVEIFMLDHLSAFITPTSGKTCLLAA